MVTMQYPTHKTRGAKMMTNITRAFWTTFVLNTVSVLPQIALAQAIVFDRDGLVESCAASPESCQFRVEDIISHLKGMDLSASEVNSQLGVIAAAVIEAAQGTGSVRFSGYGEALVVIAQSSSDPAQSSAINSVVARVSDGNLGAFDRSIATGAALGSSPG